MKVAVNGNEIELFSGARVKDALLKYAKQTYKNVLNAQQQVVDHDNHPVGLDGELTAGQHLFIIESKGGRS